MNTRNLTVIVINGAQNENILFLFTQAEQKEYSTLNSTANDGTTIGDFLIS